MLAVPLPLGWPTSPLSRVIAPTARLALSTASVSAIGAEASPPSARTSPDYAWFTRAGSVTLSGSDAKLQTGSVRTQDFT